MPNKISSSSIRTYSECSKKYYLHYIERLRPKMTNGAFLFGLAIDHALNHLLLNQQDLPRAIQIFDASWDQQAINGEMTLLKTAHNIVYAAKDFDVDLLLEEDHKEVKEFFLKRTGFELTNTTDGLIVSTKERKTKEGYNNLSDELKDCYALGHWLSLRRKGHIMLESYFNKILPQILEVKTIQKNFSIVNPDGDSLIGFVDLVAKMKDGKTYILDNKTSSSLYQWDSPMRSQQLILYYHALKEEYKADGVGFIVLYKQIKKNKTKICKDCGFNGSETRHKTCNNTIANIADENTKSIINSRRCGGEFIETLSPECEIDILLNYVPETAENLVMETFDRANEGIKKEVFAPNLFQCGDSNSDYRCQFYNLCWKNKKDDLIELGKKNEV